MGVELGEALVDHGRGVYARGRRPARRARDEPLPHRLRIGEVLGLVLATWWGWGDAASIALAVALAFFFGYLLTLIPLFRAGWRSARRSGSHSADTLSITTMEIVDNAILLASGRDGRGPRRPALLGPARVALAVAGARRSSSTGR